MDNPMTPMFAITIPKLLQHIRRTGLWSIAVLLAGDSLAVAAATPADGSRLPEAVVAFYRGAIKPERVDQFLREYADQPVSSLSITSTGGDVLAGIALGRWVHARGIPGHVKGICMSSCANYVFPAGSEKIIEPGAIVVWHGSTEQRDIREEQAAFALREEKLKEGPIDPAERIDVASRRPRYLLIQKQREQQAALLNDLLVDERLMRLGQEPNAIADAWIATVAVMEKYGLHHVRAPDNYGTANYVHANPLAMLLFKNKLDSFDLDARGMPVLVSNRMALPTK